VSPYCSVGERQTPEHVCAGTAAPGLRLEVPDLSWEWCALGGIDTNYLAAQVES